MSRLSMTRKSKSFIIYDCYDGFEDIDLTTSRVRAAAVFSPLTACACPILSLVHLSSLPSHLPNC